MRLIARGSPTGHEYAADSEWHRRLHEQLGLPWPCAVTNEFEMLWPTIAESVRVRGLALGRGAYGGWDDADPALARAVWCLTTQLGPHNIVETGVARGITSRVVLEALERAGTGHLWSIDLPAPDPTLHSEIGIAVPDNLRARWTYVAGTSRRRLPQLLEKVGPIDLFVHDSSHTERNLRFELGQAWGALRDGGAIVADDIHQSPAFASFVRALPAQASFVAEADDTRALVGIALKRSEIQA